MSYEIRYCAFVDVLGFSGFIQGLERGKTTPDAVLGILRSVHKLPHWSSPQAFRGAELKLHSFSDNICMSAPQGAGGLSHILHALEGLALAVLDHGTLLRGAVVKGNLYQDDEAVFGEALVRAYRLESGVCVYPRIMLERDVAIDWKTLLKDEFQKNFIEDFVHQSDDGPYFLNVLVSMKRYLRERNTVVGKEAIDRYNNIADKLQQRFNESVDNPRHFEKHQWFARYWNKAVQPFAAHLRKIEGPGLTKSDPTIGG